MANLVFLATMGEYCKWAPNKEILTTRRSCEDTVVVAAHGALKAPKYEATPE